MIDSSLKKSNILIVDDELANVDVLSDLLEMDGYTNIKGISDSREVISLFSVFEPDIILLDLMMPHLSGFDVMAQLKSIHSEKSYVPILVLTADISQQTKQDALAKGATDFLTKPLDLIEVLLRIKNLLFTRYLQQQLVLQNELLEDKVKERTKELLEAKEVAEASSKLKQEILNNLSHEIRTPLNGILGFSQILLEPGVNEEEKNLFNGMMNASCNDLLSVTSKLIDIAQLNSGEYEVVKKEYNLLKLLYHLQLEYSSVCEEKGVEFVFETENISDQTVAILDGEILTKILNEVVANSCIFTTNGKVIFKVVLSNDLLTCEVSDTGVGIKTNEQNQIFDEFVQGEFAVINRVGGNGLGLSLFKQFCKLINASYEMTSKAGKGTSVKITIPDIRLVEATDEVKINSDKENLNILINESDDFNFYYLKQLLELSNINIQRIADNKDVLGLVQNYVPDVILENQSSMQKFTSEELNMLRKVNPQSKFIAITNNIDFSINEKLMAEGYDEIIDKPILKRKLYYQLDKFGFSEFLK